MLTTLLTLFKNPKIIAGVLIALVLAGAYFYVHHLQVEDTALKAQVAVLNSKIADQNAAIDAQKKAADVRLAQAQADLKAAQITASKIQGKAQIIYKAVPSTPGNDCKSALDLINGSGS